MPSSGTLISEGVPKPGGRVNVEVVATSAGRLAVEEVATLAVAASEDGTLVAGWAEDWVADLVALLRGRGGWSSASPGTAAAFLWAVDLGLSSLSNIEPFPDECVELEGWSSVSFFLSFFFFFFLAAEVDIFSLMYSLTFSLNSSKIEPERSE